MENQYGKMSLAELRSLAKEKGITGITSKKKQELVELLERAQTADRKAEPEARADGGGDFVPPQQKGGDPAGRRETLPPERAGVNTAGRKETMPPERAGVNTAGRKEAMSPERGEANTAGRKGAMPPERGRANAADREEVMFPERGGANTADQAEPMPPERGGASAAGRKEAMSQERGEVSAAGRREAIPPERGENRNIPQKEPAGRVFRDTAYTVPQRDNTAQGSERRTGYTAENTERRTGYGTDGAERARGERGGYGGIHPRDNRQKGGYGRQQPFPERGERAQTNPYTNQYGGVPEPREGVSQNPMLQPPAGAAYRPNQPLTQEELEQLDSGETKEGILEIMQEGFGFIRCDNFLPGSNDVYVSPMQIRKMNLKTGDVIVGNTKIRSQTEKFSPLLYVNTINGFPPSEALTRPKFEELTPIFPNRRIHLETPGCKPAMRIMDLVSPIGKGQRGMIVSQPKAGKTTLLKQVAHAVTKNHPEMHMIILLIDERPEEVTDIKESIQSDNVEVIYSTFDELPENHKRVSEMVIERAKRLVEHGKDVIILLDSITRLARAYNLTVQSSGRTLSGGLDPAALHMPKKFFGAARNMREGGSLTILATALVETGSRMDDVVFEEFKGTGNMELVLDRNLSERRIFPAIDLPRSSTRREDLLLSQPEIEANVLMRRAFNGMKQEEAVERIIQMFASTKNNAEFIETIKKTKFAY